MLKDRLKQFFDVFSRRHKTYERDRVSRRLRNKVLLLCIDVFSGSWSRPLSNSGDFIDQFWEEIHRSLQYLHGRPKLSDEPAVRTPQQDVIAFLLNCEPQEFLDFIELIFRTDCLFHVTTDENDIVEALNEIFRSEPAPYQVTPAVKRQEQATLPYPPGLQGMVTRTVVFPKVVRAEDDVTYTEAIAPVLSVLATPAYTAVNLEFRDALEDYRKGDYGDCLVKCGSAFESAMKVLCQQKGWRYDPQDTAAPLIKIVLGNSNLDSFFEQPLMLIATLRNRLSKAHGGGDQVRQVERHVAQYAITSTAAAIALLIHETA